MIRTAVSSGRNPPSAPRADCGRIGNNSLKTLWVQFNFWALVSIFMATGSTSPNMAEQRSYYQELIGYCYVYDLMERAGVTARGSILSSYNTPWLEIREKY